MTFLRSLLAINVGALLLLTVAPASAQTKGKDNPLEYRFEYDFNYRIGGDVGFNSTWQTGAYDVGCGHFTVGANLNPFIAVSADHPLTRNLFVEAMVGYQGRAIKSTNTVTELDPLVTSHNGVRWVNVTYEEKGTGSFSYAFVLPSLKYFLFKGLFVGVGADAGILLSNQLQYTKTIISKTVDIPDIGLTEVSYPEQESSDPYSKVSPAETRNDAAKLAIDGVAYIGAELNLSGRWRLLPRLLYTIPLTSVLSTPEELKLNTFQVLVGLRYELK